jgi:hypothetical protein
MSPFGYPDINRSADGDEDELTQFDLPQATGAVSHLDVSM